MARRHNLTGILLVAVFVYFVAGVGLCFSGFPMLQETAGFETFELTPLGWLFLPVLIFPFLASMCFRY